MDNDGDGFVDEDARLAAPADSVFYLDAVDNDHNGVTDDINEAPVSKTNRNLGFVNNYLNANPGSAWVKIKKGDATMNLRIQIQNDSLTLPANLAIMKGSANSALKTRLLGELDSAKTLIGGCFRNYP